MAARRPAPVSIGGRVKTTNAQKTTLGLLGDMEWQREESLRVQFNETRVTRRGATVQSYGWHLIHLERLGLVESARSRQGGVRWRRLIPRAECAAQRVFGL